MCHCMSVQLCASDRPAKIGIIISRNKKRFTCYITNSCLCIFFPCISSDSRALILYLVSSLVCFSMSFLVANVKINYINQFDKRKYRCCSKSFAFNMPHIIPIKLLKKNSVSKLTQMTPYKWLMQSNCELKFRSSFVSFVICVLSKFTFCDSQDVTCDSVHNDVILLNESYKFVYYSNFYRIFGLKLRAKYDK